MGMPRRLSLTRDSLRFSAVGRTAESTESLDLPIREQLENEARFGGDFQMRLTGRGENRPSGRSGKRSDRSAGAASRDSADDRAETRAAEDLASGLLTFAAGFRLGEIRHYRIR